MRDLRLISQMLVKSKFLFLMPSLSKLIPMPIRKLHWFGDGSSCGLSFMALVLLTVGSALAQPKANLATYEKDVLPLLEAFCMDCHDADTKKGRFDRGKPLLLLVLHFFFVASLHPPRKRKS